MTHCINHVGVDTHAASLVAAAADDHDPQARLVGQFGADPRYSLGYRPPAPQAIMAPIQAYSAALRMPELDNLNVRRPS